ncbi:hypothetical protein EDEG_03559 [Edhazardia aedis USNM 41457]|uniref:Uncharacterized protein n=1 Tax=Edhazardia aedis (strain USNM 41457) TaxID=1003232 RepID=J9DKS0_EDHAE|nr:hypothetical protein EDEG_03559 [Edhazardia aedis USNM 41457]|eukprot:EJW01987.1 hypothetical protein EDEG_03559 [Edhazardia aedis USNM 41457]
MNECKHIEIFDSICLECGLTLQTAEVFDDSYVFTENTSMPIKMNIKNIIYDKRIYIMNSIRHVLGILNKTEYENHVFDFIVKKTFTTRLGINTKVCASIYFILKNMDFPILLKDFDNYVKGGYRFLQIVLFRNFPYSKPTKTYLDAIIDRIINHLNEFDYIFHDGCSLKEEVYRLSQERSKFNFVDYIILKIFENQCIDFAFEKYELHKFSSKESLQSFANSQEYYFKKNKRNNKTVHLKVDKAVNKIFYNQNIYDVNIDEIDLIIERMLLNGINENTIKSMSLKEIRKFYHID